MTCCMHSGGNCGARVAHFAAVCADLRDGDPNASHACSVFCKLQHHADRWDPGPRIVQIALAWGAEVRRRVHVRVKERTKTSPSRRPMTSSRSVDIAWVVHVQNTSACIRPDVPGRGGGGATDGR